MVFNELVFTGIRMRPFAGTSLSGNYVFTGSEDSFSFVQAIEFIDEKRLNLSFLPLDTTTNMEGEYEIYKSYLIIKLIGSLQIMEILCEEFLQGDPIGFGGYGSYIRREE